MRGLKTALVLFIVYFVLMTILIYAAIDQFIDAIK